MQAGIGQIVAVAGGGDGAHIADVLHHGGQGQGHDGDGGGDQQGGVQVVPAEQAEDRAAPTEGQTHPGGFLDGGEVHVAGDGGDGIGGHNTQEDGDDLNHALAEDVGGDHHQNGHQSNPPVGLAVVDGGGAEGQADADDDGAGNDGREEAHDLLDAEDLEQGGQDDVHETGQGHAEAGVGQQAGVHGAVHHGDGLVAADEGEGGAQEGGNLALGQQVEEQRAQTGEQQGGGHAQPGQSGDQHRGAEHGKHVLDAQHQHFGHAQLAGVVNAGLGNGFFGHLTFSFLSWGQKKEPKQNCFSSQKRNMRLTP